MHLGVNTLFHVPGDVGGTETYLREMLRALLQENKDDQFTLFTQLDNDHVVKKWCERHSRVRYVCLPFKARFRPVRIVVEQTLLPFYLLTSGIDLLWSPGYTAPYFAVCPQVVTIHDLQYKKHPEDLTRLERLTLDVLARTACRRAQNIIAVSAFSRREIVRHKFAPAEKVHAVLEGVDLSFAHPVEDHEISRRVGEVFPVHAPYILCVAHTYPHKNVEMLIEAFHTLQDRIPHNLVLVGRPRLGEAEVTETLSRLGPMPRLYRFKDGLDFPALKFLFQRADLFVLPSEYEGFGLPVIEALMAGTPVVCSNKASLPEVAGDFAYYVDPLTVSELAGKIKEALEVEAKERVRRCEKAQEWAQHFTWQKAARHTRHVFDQSLQKS